MSTSSITSLRQRMIEDFQARQLSMATQRSHIHSCKRFAAFPGRSPDSATTDDIRRFQHHLSKEGLSICNRNRVMTGVKFLVRVTVRRLDLANEIYHLREPQKIPLVMNQDEAKRLLLMAPVKVRVLLSLSYGCGLRAGEVVRLKAGDIDSAQSIIRVVQAKGRKDRHVMGSKDLLKQPRQWWKIRSTRNDAGILPGERWLFPGRGRGCHLTTRQFSRIFHEAVDAAGITKPVTLHSLRHYFATHLLARC
jgi:integrase/recombinase XerD